MVPHPKNKKSDHAKATALSAKRNFKWLMTKREQEAVKSAGRIYKRRFCAAPTSDQNLIVHIGDNPKKYLCWSGVSKRIPTLRLASGKYWHYASRRWLTTREKLASLGLPVSPGCALSMSVPILPVKDWRRALTLAGNSMHLGNILMVSMIALACCRKIDHE